MELILALVCDDAYDTPDGKLDIRGVFNDLYAHGFPAQQDRMTLVLVIEWDRSDHGRFQFSVDLKNDRGEPSLSITGHTDVDERPADRPPARTRLVLPLEDVVFLMPGAYRFDLRVKGREIPGPTVQLIRTEPPSEEVGPSAESASEADLPSPPGPHSTMRPKAGSRQLPIVGKDGRPFPRA